MAALSAIDEGAKVSIHGGVRPTLEVGPARMTTAACPYGIGKPTLEAEVPAADPLRRSPNPPSGPTAKPRQNASDLGFVSAGIPAGGLAAVALLSGVAFFR